MPIPSRRKGITKKRSKIKEKHKYEKKNSTCEKCQNILKQKILDIPLNRMQIMSNILIMMTTMIYDGDDLYVLQNRRDQTLNRFRSQGSFPW